MVKSNINEEIQYIEKKTIDPEDKGHASSLYIIKLHSIEVVIVLGKPKYTYSAKGVIYYPIYIVSGNKIKSQIGVFEATLSNSIRLVDEDGDIDVDKLGEPIIYSFVTEKYLKSANSDPQSYADAERIPTISDTNLTKRHINEDNGDGDNNGDGVDSDSDNNGDRNHGNRNHGNDDDIKSKKSTKEDDSDEDIEDEDIFAVRIAKSNSKSPSKLKEKGIFVIDPHFRRPETLTEETEADAEEIKRKYHESSANLWIEDFMKNNHYGILENEGGGDCLFATIRDAYEHIGYKTTVSKLRELLAAQVTIEKFENDRKLYLEFEARKIEIKNNMRELKESIDEYGKRAKKLSKSPTNADQKAEISTIIDSAKALAEKYEAEKTELKKTERDQTDFIGNMKNIETLEQYREYIKSSNYWADAWAIATLEALLKMKVVILSEEAYKAGFHDGILNCGAISSLIEDKPFNPEYYIMVSYTGDHYRLITYKGRHILNYKELPYNVKILVVNKCLEKNAGIYYKIQDFRNFKSMLGIQPDEGAPHNGSDADEDSDTDTDIDSTAENIRHSHLYTHTAVFVFHAKSLATAKPGMGTGESIDADRRSEFTALAKIPNWRRKLDDSWTESPFRVDNHMWASVDHYVEASRFKKGFPDFYTQFSLDNPSNLSKDPELAKAAADLKKSKHKALRPANIKEDVDYSLGRRNEEREIALRAKFTQNEDLKHLLHATRDATLKKYLRRQPAKKDLILMGIRAESW